MVCVVVVVVAICVVVVWAVVVVAAAVVDEVLAQDVQVLIRIKKNSRMAKIRFVLIK